MPIAYVRHGGVRAGSTGGATVGGGEGTGVGGRGGAISATVWRNDSGTGVPTIVGASGLAMKMGGCDFGLPSGPGRSAAPTSLITRRSDPRSGS